MNLMYRNRMEVPGKLNTDVVSEHCEACQISGTSKQADGFCNECHEHMCLQCFQDHLKGKMCRNHVLGPVDQANAIKKQEIEATEHCKKHVSEKLKYYCHQHDAVACGDCTITEHHGCKMQFIQDLAKNFKESPELKDILKQIQRLKKDIEESGNKVQRNKNENASSAEKALEGIIKFRKEINKYLDSAEADIVAEVTKLSKENEVRMSSLERKMTQLLLDIDELKANIDTKQYQEDNLFIHFVQNKVHVRDIEDSTTNIKGKNNIQSFVFEPEQKLKEIMHSKVKFGILKLVSQTKPESASHRELARETDSVDVTRDETQEHARKEKSQDEATSMPQQVYLQTDPRLAGFDVGKRVRHKFYDWLGKLLYQEKYIGGGIITAVDPAGYVDVTWKSGYKSRVTAGAKGRYDVELTK